MACIATVADAIMRIVACDVPSQLSLHYAGKADGPHNAIKGSGGFGIEMRVFEAESSTFLLTDPSLVLVRTQVLDYFEDQRKHVKDDCILFRWERSMTVGSSEKELLDRVSLEMQK